MTDQEYIEFLRFDPKKISLEYSQLDELRENGYLKSYIFDYVKEKLHRILFIDNEKYDHLFLVNAINAWNKMIEKMISNEKKLEKEKEKQKKKKKKTRKTKVPINLCRDIKELNADKDICYNGFYETAIDGRQYIFDIVKTSNMNYYVGITDVTDKYETIDFNEFKKKHAQPNLFDFFDI